MGAIDISTWLERYLSRAGNSTVEEPGEVEQGDIALYRGAISIVTGGSRGYLVRLAGLLAYIGINRLLI